MTSNRGRFFSSMMGIHTDSHTWRTSNIQDQTTGKQTSTTESIMLNATCGYELNHIICHKHVHSSFALPVPVISEHTEGLWDLMYALYCIYTVSSTTYLNWTNSSINLNAVERKVLKWVWLISSESNSSPACDVLSSCEDAPECVSQFPSRKCD